VSSGAGARGGAGGGARTVVSASASMSSTRTTTVTNAVCEMTNVCATFFGVGHTISCRSSQTSFQNSSL